MKIARAPLRITLGGGGTDLPGYYEKHGGFLIAGAINKYIYMTGSLRPFDKKYWLSYSKLEVCDSVEQIQHDMLRQALAKYKLPTGVELHSVSELPGGSGLGSSGAFLVCALHLLNAFEKKEMTRQDLAELASRIEMVELGRSCGKQDQYSAAFGGIVALEIAKDGRVTVEDLRLAPSTVKRLENNLLMYHTGFSRDANDLLKRQSRKLASEEGDAVSRMMKIKDIGYRSRDCLVSGDLDGFGRLLHEHWELKRSMQSEMSNPRIDEVYALALENGSLGGKLIGAGGGGFLMFYVPADRHRPFQAAMERAGLLELDWRFSFSGCETIFAN